MPSLVIPQSGLSLGNFPAASLKPGSAVPDVFGLTLTDGVIEEMIKCVQNGKPIQLSLGDHPSISYGSKAQNLSTTQQPFEIDIFQSTNFSNSSSTPDDDMAYDKSKKLPQSSGKGVRLPANPNRKYNLLFPGMKLGFKPAPPRGANTGKATPQPHTTSGKPLSSTAGDDAALAALQSSMAEENAKKAGNTTKYFKDGVGLPALGRRGAAKPSNKSKFLSQNRLGSDTTRSMPSSPALSGVGSPSLGPTSVPLSQQQAEKDKAARKPVIHLLAVEPLTEKALREKVPESAKDNFKHTLSKVGDLNESTGKWELRKQYYKELDVWTYRYSPEEDRQRAIDNAVRQFDKMRMGLSEPEWDRLLVKSERGTGKHLSKLQSKIAQGPVARPPKINLQKAEDSGRDTPNGDEDIVTDKNLSKVKGENLPRSISQPPTTKSKKVSEKEAQARRLLSKNPTKATTPKQAPAKKVPQPKPGSKVLSSEFVNESDEEEDYVVPVKSVTKPATKRARPEGDDDTSDSSIPLMKKVKKDPKPTHRVSDASQSSLTTNTSHYSSSSSKVKRNSPQKSSPLASSPPTNASDMEQSSGDHTSSSESPAHHLSTKNTHTPIHKNRHQKSSSVSSSGSSRYLKPEVTDLARRFKMFYPKYEALHRELLSMGEHRDKQKERDLLEMHARLAGMKKDIQAGIVDVEN